MDYQLGVALTGGGARGVAHLGLLKALEEEGIKPDVISGASAGALVGALYAGGFSLTESLDFFKTTPVFSFTYFSFYKPGFLEIIKYRKFFEKYFPEDQFEALKIPLFISTTNLVEATYEIFSSGQLITPMLASSALPPLFTPVEINGKLYADGGIMNNFPVEPLKGKCQYIIGSNVNPVKQIEKDYYKNSLRVFLRATDLRYYAESMMKYKDCDYVFEPDELSNFGMLDTDNIDELYEIGYRHAKEVIGVIIDGINKTASQDF